MHTKYIQKTRKNKINTKKWLLVAIITIYNDVVFL